MSATPPSGVQAQTVLLIEDSPGDARLIAEMLREGRGARFRLENAERLSPALARLAQPGIAVVLLDLSLPESQGLDTFQRVHAGAHGIPIVVLTGMDDEEVGNRAVQAGAQDYLVKGQVDGPLLERALRYAIERGRIEEELRQRVAELAAADRRKDEFLATLAHELRNPLAPLRNSLHLLRLSGGISPAAAPVHEMMERQITHLVRLVDDLMEVSRITRGKIELHKECTDLAAVLQSAIETSQPLIEAAHQVLDIHLPTEPLLLEGDFVRLTQVFANLLNNAAKYTQENGHIWVSARREDDKAIVSVRDSGVGIPPEMLPRIFDLFAQVDRTLQRAKGGLGIGLTLARTLAEMHGGRIEASSGGPGQGCEFVVYLPLAGAGKESVRQPGVGLSLKLSPTLRVLVVDDNHDAADSLGMLLQYLGADVRVAYDGPSALAAARTYQPSLALLDIGMPGMDGYELARQIRKEPSLQSLTLIALTGWGQAEDRRRSRAAGFNDHLVKPANAETLQNLLATCAARLERI